MNADHLTHPADLAPTRHGADVDRPPRADESQWQADGRYFANANDAARVRQLAAERAQRDAERRAHYEAPQREAATPAAPAVELKRLQAARARRAT